MIDYGGILLRSMVIPLASAGIWQILRALWLLIALGEPFLQGLLVKPKVSSKSDRNVIHAKLGTVHCLSVLSITLGAMYLHRDETWEQWNFQRTLDLDSKHFLNPFWSLWISVGYFISDFFYISDFPAYYWHHLVAISELCILVSDTECSMVAAQGLFVAEVGGILLTVYLQFKSVATYFLFIFFYGFSRFILLPIFIYHMWRSSLLAQMTANFYVAMFSNVMSLLLMLINWNFWWTHVKKFTSRVGRNTIEEETKTNKKTGQKAPKRSSIERKQVD